MIDRIIGVRTAATAAAAGELFVRRGIRSAGVFLLRDKARHDQRYDHRRCVLDQLLSVEVQNTCVRIRSTHEFGEIRAISAVLRRERDEKDRAIERSREEVIAEGQKECKLREMLMQAKRI